LAIYGKIPDYRYRLIDYVGDGIMIGSTTPPAPGAAHAPSNVPCFDGKLAGRLAVLWALESGMSLAHRRREDHWNHIVAGIGTYALAIMHRGAPAAARSALLAGHGDRGVVGRRSEH
jgi:import inner membrane translocase subunit TIM17